MSDELGDLGDLGDLGEFRGHDLEMGVNRRSKGRKTVKVAR